jgi:hypothetical protein
VEGRHRLGNLQHDRRHEMKRAVAHVVLQGGASASLATHNCRPDASCMQSGQGQNLLPGPSTVTTPWKHSRGSQKYDDDPSVESNAHGASDESTGIQIL